MMVRWYRHSSVLVLWLLVFSLSGCQGAAVPGSINATVTPNPELTIQPCQLGIQAECAVLRVPENWSDSASRRINLAIVRIAATGRSRQQDPLFLLAGGPGQAATQTYLPLLSIFGKINQERDLIIFDQRGTGSSNALSCPEQSSPDSLAVPDSTEEAERQRLLDCLHQLKGDPRFYTTLASVEDIDAVRGSFGYERINLLGVSYGTRLALEYLRAYPNHVRTMILDGVVPPGWPLGESASTDAQTAIDRILNSCLEKLSCQQAFPNLTTEFATLFSFLDAHPSLVSVPDPTTGKLTQVLLTRARAASTIQMLSYTSETASLLPLLIHSAVASKDYQALAAQFLIIQKQLKGSVAEGLYYSVVCTEDVPFFHVGSAVPSMGYLPDQVSSLENTCSTWTHAQPAGSMPDPVHSDTPVLLLSGEFDPVTPPANADNVARGLTHSLEIIAPGMGHNVFYRGCLPQIILAFLQAGSEQRLDTRCVEQVQPLPFFTSFTGPLN